MLDKVFPDCGGIEQIQLRRRWSHNWQPACFEGAPAGRAYEAGGACEKYLDQGVKRVSDLAAAATIGSPRLCGNAVELGCPDPTITLRMKTESEDQTACRQPRST